MPIDVVMMKQKYKIGTTDLVTKAGQNLHALRKISGDFLQFCSGKQLKFRFVVDKETFICLAL